MNTILIAFILSLILSMILTPFFGRVGSRFGALDYPHERKMHNKPIPRIGGLAIFISFICALLGIWFFKPEIFSSFWDRRIISFCAGGFFCFGIGLIDDFRRLGYKTKLLVQVAGASLAFLGGTSISFLVTHGEVLSLLPSYLITVFWFLLFMNAVNLIDGLDGLAGGICFFASVIMVLLSIMRGEIMLSVLYAVLAGSILGFLRYNFNPASIFMGDGGSYFLGYMIAGLSILGSQKSQVGVTILIPLLAMGVPVFDTVLSPIRRFIVGKELFKPDTGHVHHRLVKMGFSAKRTVLIIYGMSLVLCIFAVILVNLRDEQAGLLLVFIGAGAVLLTHKLGYFEYLAYDKLYGWFRDVSDAAGFTRDRRSFLNIQMEIASSPSITELWENAGRAFEMLNFDRVLLHLSSGDFGRQSAVREWTQLKPELGEKTNREDLLRLELPLSMIAGEHFGKLILEKDLKKDPLSHFTLRRVEHLRRTLVSTLQRIQGQQSEKEIYNRAEAR